MNFEELLKTAINATIKGGHVIMDLYTSNFTVEQKEDNSPLTLADKNCNAIIEADLEETNIPILSEEGENKSFSERKNWEYLWLVDPLDGTKEFIKRNGEFTVNIALIHHGSPVMGVIYAPVKEELYFALEGMGSYKTSRDSIIRNLEELILNSNKLPISVKRDSYIIVNSRSHMSEKTEQFFKEKKNEHSEVEVVEVGSSLKLCMVAEGKADAYPRYASTMEWDTAAGHAIAKFAGFSVKQYNSSDDVGYNKEDLLNPWFLVK